MMYLKNDIYIKFKIKDYIYFTSDLIFLTTSLIQVEYE